MHSPAAVPFAGACAFFHLAVSSLGSITNDLQLTSGKDRRSGYREQARRERLVAGKLGGTPDGLLLAGCSLPGQRISDAFQSAHSAPSTAFPCKSTTVGVTKMGPPAVCERTIEARFLSRGEPVAGLHRNGGFVSNS